MPSPDSSISARASFPSSKNSRRFSFEPLPPTTTRPTSTPSWRSLVTSKVPSLSSSSCSRATLPLASKLYFASMSPSPSRSSSWETFLPSWNTTVVSILPFLFVSASRLSGVSPSKLVMISGFPSPVWSSSSRTRLPRAKKRWISTFPSSLVSSSSRSLLPFLSRWTVSSGGSVSVLVAGLLALEAFLEEGHAVEAAVAGGVGFATQHALAVLVEGHEVGLAVPLGVLLEAKPLVAPEDQGRVVLAVAGAVLQLGLLRAIRVELGPNLPLAVEVLVELDAGRLPVLVRRPAIGIAVEVGVLFEASRLVAVVGEVRVGRAVAVLVIELKRGLAVAEGDEAILRAVRVRVLILPGGRLPVLGEEGPDVDAIVEVAVAFGPLGDTADVVDELVEATVLVGVGLLLGELFVVVVGELDRRTGRLSRLCADEDEACRERGSNPGRNHHSRSHSVGTIRQRGC